MFLTPQVARAEHTQQSRLGLPPATAATAAAPSSPSSLPLPSCFRMLLEDRTQCNESGAVSYRTTPTSLLMLQVGVGACVSALVPCISG